MASINDLRKQALGNDASTKEATQQKIAEMQKKKQEQLKAAADQAVDAAIEREQEQEKTRMTPAQELMENYEFKHHDVPPVNGFNISDSLHRRRDFANEQVAKIQEQMANEDVSKEIAGETSSESSAPNDVTTETSNQSDNEPQLDDNYMDEVEREIQKELEGEKKMEQNEAVVIDTTKHSNMLQQEQEEQSTNEPMSIEAHMPEKEEIATPSAVEVSIEDLETPNTTETEEVAAQPQLEVVKSATTPAQALTPSIKEVIDTEVKNVENINMYIDEEDIKDIKEDLESEITEDKMKGAIEIVKKQIAERLELDLHNDVTAVSTKGVSLSEAMSVMKQQSALTTLSGDWVLVSAGRTVTMKAWSGTELDALHRDASGRNRFNTLREIFRMIYDHIISAKEATYTDWLKNTSFFDIEHLYMAIYNVCFAGKNYIPYNCEDDKCRHPFLSDNKSMDSMIYFEDDDIKDRFYKIKESSDIKDPYLYKSKVEPICGPIGIKFKEPSIYDTVFESSSLDEAFSKKYHDLIQLFVYVDGFYIFQNGEWHEVTYNVDPTSISKTTKTKIVTWAKLMAEISSDGYQKVNKIIDSIDTVGNKVKYRLPEEVCPKCGKPVAADARSAIMDATALVFSRHQLARI